jgi:transcriptional regulator
MYVPRFNAADDVEELRALVSAVGVAWVITAGEGGAPDATLLPIVWRDDSVIVHFAKANDHWQRITEGQQVLVVVSGPDAYVSPRWYAAKQEHGRVVPTWNYSAVELRGTASVHHESDWLNHAVSTLTDVHEAGSDHPWQVTDAPDAYVAGQLRGIVGLEVAVTSVTGKQKLNQNRSAADRAGVVAGIRAEGGDLRVADAMARTDQR